VAIAATAFYKLGLDRQRVGMGGSIASFAQENT
jgi:hypothetical protein